MQTLKVRLQTVKGQVADGYRLGCRRLKVRLQTVKGQVADGLRLGCKRLKVRLQTVRHGVKTVQGDSALCLRHNSPTSRGWHD